MLRRKPLIYFALALAFLQALPAPAQQGAERNLRQRIEAAINAPDYQQATWALLVLDSKTGEVVYEHNADRLILPASVTKLYSITEMTREFDISTRTLRFYEDEGLIHPERRGRTRNACWLSCSSESPRKA